MMLVTTMMLELLDICMMNLIVFKEPDQSNTFLHFAYLLNLKESDKNLHKIFVFMCIFLTTH